MDWERPFASIGRFVFGIIWLASMFWFFATASLVEKHVLARQEKLTYPSLGVTTPCSVKGGSYFCTPFEANFLTYSNYGVMVVVALGLGIILIQAAKRNAENNPATPEPPQP